MPVRLSRVWSTMAVASVCASSCTRLGYDLLDPPAGAAASSSGGGASGGASGNAGASVGGSEPNAGDGGTDAGGASEGGAPGSAAQGGAGATQTPPVAALTVTPGVGDTTTEFMADGSASTDAEDGSSGLGYEWDWESDGTFDDSGMSATHVYAAEGTYTITLRVTDSDGASATDTAEVSVVPSGDILVVTTGTDEQDPGADPATPGGSGFSLREAIIVSNITAGKQTITVAAGVTKIDLTLGQLEPLTSTADLFGYGVVVDGAALTGSPNCFFIDGDEVKIFGFEITNCPSRPVYVVGGNDTQVSDCFMHDNGGPVATASGSGHLIGPNNVAMRADAHCVFINAPTSVIGNVVSDCGTAGIQVAGGAPGSTVRHNLVLRAPIGISISSNADNLTIVNNTIDSASSNGMTIGGIANLTLVNNSVTNNDGWGIVGADSAFGTNSHNLLFGNGNGDCSSCTLPNALLEDPLYIDPAADDFRPGVDSPLIDAGLDVGFPYDGSAPDIGYYETTP